MQTWRRGHPSDGKRFAPGVRALSPPPRPPSRRAAKSTTFYRARHNSRADSRARGSARLWTRRPDGVQAVSATQPAVGRPAGVAAGCERAAALTNGAAARAGRVADVPPALAALTDGSLPARNPAARIPRWPCPFVGPSDCPELLSATVRSCCPPLSGAAGAASASRRFRRGRRCRRWRRYRRRVAVAARGVKRGAL